MAAKQEIIDSFESAYRGVPPWETGRPQKEIIKLEAAGEIHGRVLDVGCGTGENVLYLANKKYDVIGIDVVSAAIHKARKKGRSLRVNGLFLVHDALHLDGNGLKFDTIIDSGLFHVFSNEARDKFVSNIHHALCIGGTYLMICFNENEPPGWGPRRVTREEIKNVFINGFTINYIKEAEFQTNRPQGSAKSWLSSITKL